MKSKAMHILTVAAVAVGALALPSGIQAQTGLTVEATEVAACETGTFTILVSGGAGTYDLTWDFGDSETLLEPAVAGFPHSVDHAYPGSGDYTWTVLASDSATPELTGLATGSLVIGPSVTLTSDIFPPALTLEDGQASLTFTASVTGGEAPYTFGWDLDGDGVADPGADPTSATATFVYAAPGTYQASVTVTDNCGLTAMDTLTVVVFDTDENACHPTAQKIAQAVSSLFPDQAESLYSCEDIFNFFTGGLTGSQLGFGRMWHAYKLALAIDELTWEEILDWHLDGTGWGLLTQIDRFAEALDEIDTRQLYEMVMAGDASVKDIRTAVQAVIRFDADFEEALVMLGEGATPGELGRFYRTADELEMDTASLDAMLETGLTLAEISHAGRLADRFGGSADEIAANHAAGLNWGEINKTLRSGQEDVEAIGPIVFSQGQGNQNREQVEAEQHARLTERLAEQYGATVEEVEALWISCSGDWSCVREALRSHEAEGGAAPRDDSTAQRIASQYGVGVDQVWSVYNGSCDGSWSCVRKHFRGNGRPGK